MFWQRQPKTTFSAVIIESNAFYKHILFFKPIGNSYFNNICLFWDENMKTVSRKVSKKNLKTRWRHRHKYVNLEGVTSFEIRACGFQNVPLGVNVGVLGINSRYVIEYFQRSIILIINNHQTDQDHHSYLICHAGLILVGDCTLYFPRAVNLLRRRFHHDIFLPVSDR